MYCQILTVIKATKGEAILRLRIIFCVTHIIVRTGKILFSRNLLYHNIKILHTCRHRGHQDMLFVPKGFPMDSISI